MGNFGFGGGLYFSIVRERARLWWVAREGFFPLWAWARAMSSEAKIEFVSSFVENVVDFCGKIGVCVVG